MERVVMLLRVPGGAGPRAVPAGPTVPARYVALVTAEVDDMDPSPGLFTPFMRLDEVLVDHANSLRAALGTHFVGLYPVGSLAIGDFDLTSDVDFAVITTRELDEGEVLRIQAAHSDLLGRDSRWVQHLEYSFFALPELRRLSSPYGPGGTRTDIPDRQLWYFGNASRMIERSDHDNTLVTRWTLRYASRPIDGPEPISFAPDITPRALRNEIRNSLLGWEQLLLTDPEPLRNRFHQVFLVLNNCRALQDLEEGRITSKLDGARWAKQHLDRRWHELIDFCWQERQDTSIHISQPADPDAFARTIEFMSYGAQLAAGHQVPTE
jgi:hypothetical protein